MSNRRHFHAFTNTSSQKEVNSWRYVFEIFVLRQFLLDILEELEETKGIKGVFRGKMIEAKSYFNDMRKRLNRNMGKKNMLKFEERVCDTVDGIQAHVDVCKAVLRSELVQKLKYEDVEAAMLVAMAGGVTRVMQSIYKSLQGKENYELSKIDECIEYIDQNAHFRLLNKDVIPDENVVAQPFVELFKEIEKRIVVEKRGNEFIWVA